MLINFILIKKSITTFIPNTLCGRFMVVIWSVWFVNAMNTMVATEICRWKTDVNYWFRSYNINTFSHHQTCNAYTTQNKKHRLAPLRCLKAQTHKNRFLYCDTPKQCPPGSSIYFPTPFRTGKTGWNYSNTLQKRAKTLQKYIRNTPLRA